MSGDDSTDELDPRDSEAFLGDFDPITTTIQNPQIWAILCENGATGGTSLPS